MCTKKGKAKRRWWWRIKAGNGEIILCSQMLGSKQSAKTIAKRVQSFLKQSWYEEIDVKRSVGEVIASMSAVKINDILQS